MITRFHIANFKSLVDFHLTPPGETLPQFTCLIGLNGSGKSTLLQAIDFVASIGRGRADEWLGQRGWRSRDILSKAAGVYSDTVRFEVGFREPAGREVLWRASYNVRQGRCTKERFSINGNTLLEVESDRLGQQGTDGQRKEEKIGFNYRGSILSSLKLEGQPALQAVHSSLNLLKSLELLSPQLLRRRAKAARDIGVGGEELSAFLAGLNSDKRNTLLDSLKRFYPRVTQLQLKSLQAGWKDLLIVETYDRSRTIQASHINDGMLRIMAILAQVQTGHQFLLFDEIENGINPELIRKLVEFLTSCGRQVMVTTHSPMILNYIPDEIAKQGVILLYLNSLGQTRAVRFFDLPETRARLEVLGPGEVFADTPLADLAASLEAEPPTPAAVAPVA